jgi:hypothetical protein
VRPPILLTIGHSTHEPAAFLDLLCAEAAWWRCHRRLIADVFVLDGWDVEHVMPDGRLIAHELPGFLVPGADGLPTYP